MLILQIALFPKCTIMFNETYYQKLVNKEYPSLILIDTENNTLAAMSIMVKKYVDVHAHITVV